MNKSHKTFKNNDCDSIINHSECSFSSAPDGSLTAGQGKLDYWGYWEYPCQKCKQEMERKIESEHKPKPNNK